MSSTGGVDGPYAGWAWGVGVAPSPKDAGADTGCRPCTAAQSSCPALSGWAEPAPSCSLCYPSFPEDACGPRHPNP